MLASSLAAISIGTPLRSTRAWIKAPWMADTQRPASRSARRAGNPSATSLSVRMVNSPVRCPTRLRHGAVRRGQLEQHCRDREAVSIHISGDHGWFVAHWGDTYVAQPAGERRSRKGYITCVLERRNGEWKARMHATFLSGAQ